MSNVAQVGEVVAAQAFLRAIGANYQSTDLIYAVVAWMRTSEGGRANLWGNNPFNLRASTARFIPSNLIAGTKYRIGYGTLLRFATLTDGVKAMAAYLKGVVKVAGGSWLGYGLILRAFKAGNPVDSLIAIALSAWDAAHYGFDTSNRDPSAALAKSAIYKVYASFTGLQMPTPKQPKPAPPKPEAPNDLPAPPLAHPYIEPHRAAAFYRERHKQDDFLE